MGPLSVVVLSNRLSVLYIAKEIVVIAITTENTCAAARRRLRYTGYTEDLCVCV